MERYWLFISKCYYPSGGFHDLYGDYQEIEQCKKTFEDVIKGVSAYQKDEYSFHVFDSETKQIVLDNMSEYQKKEVFDYALNDKTDSLRKVWTSHGRDK